MLDNFILRHRIRTSLLIGFFIFIILPASVVGVFSFWQSKQVLEKSIYNSLDYLSKAETNAITNWSNDRKDFITGLANNPRIQSMEKRSANEFMSQSMALDHNFKSLVLVDLDGKVIVDTDHQGKFKISLPVDRDFFKQAIKGKTVIYEVLLSHKNDTRVVIVATPVKQKDVMVGVLYGAVNIEVITSLVQQVSPGTKGEAYLVNARGEVVGKPNRRFIKTVAVQRMASGLSGMGVYDNYLNEKVFGAYRWLPQMNMGLIVEKEYSTAMLNAGLRTYYAVVLSLAIVVSWFVIFSIYYSRRLAKPLETLATEVNSIAEGNFRSIINIRANREVEDLVHSINHMSTSLFDSTNQLNSLVKQLEQSREELSREKDKLSMASITDDLTGLYNRRHLNHELVRLVNLSVSLEKNISLMMFDLDYFKRVNDTFGHATGDVVLKEFSTLLRKNSRATDVVGRIGGEEFVLIVPFVKARAIKDIAERIRKEVQDFIFDEDHYQISMSVSIGVVTIRKTHDNPEELAKELLQLADECLYQAKHAGRNKVVHKIINPMEAR